MRPAERRSGPTRFLAMSGPERRLWLAAWLALARAGLALRFSPRRALARALAAPEPPARRRVSSPELVARAVASAAAHHVGTPRCLPRALALRRLLLARGHAARVRIGVRREDGALAAHAWVEVDGAPVGEPEAIEARFLSFAGPAPGAP